MKRSILVLVFVGLIAAGLPAQAQTQFSLQFKGGLNLLGGGDLKTGGEGMFNFLNVLFRAFGFTTTGTYAGPGLGMNFGGDAIMKFGSGLGVGLGAGYLDAGKASILTVAAGGTNANLTFNTKANAIPLTLSLYYFLPTSSSLSIFLRAGAGYYIAKGTFDYTLSGTGVTSSTATYDATGGGLGFHGGLGFEYAFSPQFGMLAEVTGRYASFGGFDATLASTGSATESGKLFAYDYLAGTAGTFHELAVATTAPSGVGISNSQEAKIDFSGFSFVIGIFIRL